MPEDDFLPAVSSTAFAPPKGPSGRSTYLKPASLLQSVSDNLLHPSTMIQFYCVTDISTSKEEVPVQPHLRKFPRTQHGTSKRAFNSSWYRHNSWLEYSVSKDSSYCFACRHFSLPNAPDSAFTSDVGFSNWKKALSNESGFKLHSKSELHVNAMYAWSEYKRAKETNQTPLNLLNENRQKKSGRKQTLYQNDRKCPPFDRDPKHTTKGTSRVSRIKQ